MDGELVEFKSRIDLREYAAGLGYMLDRRESSRCSSVMRHDGDKIVIKRNVNGHYVYFSVHDDADNGTIVDFVQRRKNFNIGQVRKALRPWLGRPAAPVPLFAKLETSPKDRGAVEQAYSRMQIAARHPYLEDKRKLPPALLGSPRFAGRIRIDEHGNAVFPHFDQFGLCGYELKNEGFTGFAKGGEKGLWESHDQPDDTALVFAESAIDALSHAALFPRRSSRYRSMSGFINPRQPQLIEIAIAEMPPGAEIICATDNDEAGRKLAGMVEECFKGVSRSDLIFKPDAPATAKDWNQILQTLSGSSTPGQTRPLPATFPAAGR
jgi:hypothetical protein